MMMQQSEIGKKDGFNHEKKSRKGANRPSRGSDGEELLGMFDESQVNIQEEDSENSYESYWEEEEISNDSIPFDIVIESKQNDDMDESYIRKSIPNGSFQKTNNKKTRLVKKYRCKSRDGEKRKDNRFTTMSEKVINAKEEGTRNKNNKKGEKNLTPDQYEEAIYQKNEEIAQLKTKL